MTVRQRPLLIVEDDSALQKQMRWAFDRFETIPAADRETAVAQLRRHEPAVVIMDLGLPPVPNEPREGFALLDQIVRIAPETRVIVLTGQNDRSNAIRAIGMGAYDFYEKPFAPEILSLAIDRAFRLYDLQEENRRLRSTHLHNPLAGIITGDPALQQVCRTIERVANVNATVALFGESGTGKELLARAVHTLSNRRGKRFVAINCAAIPENLIESELFGFERGAFTGAMKQTPGKVEFAHQGTLFLDEIGDLPTPLQAKLLRFLQERVIERIGGREEIPVDTRIVCATHQDLKALISAGRFREDLYYRLAEVVIQIPPLRQRNGDASLLTHAFIRKFAGEQGRGAMTILPEAIEAIQAQPWPGNVRELENCVKRAVIMAESNTLRAADFGLGETLSENGTLNLRAVRERAERGALIQVLGRVNGNLSRAAELLGISRPTLYDLMHRYGLK